MDTKPYQIIRVKQQHITSKIRFMTLSTMVWLHLSPIQCSTVMRSSLVGVDNMVRITNGSRGVVKNE